MDPTVQVTRNCMASMYDELYSAILNNEYISCRYLLDKWKHNGMDLKNFELEPNEKIDSLPILHVACMYRRYEIVKLFMEYGFSVSNLDAFGRSAACLCLHYWPRVWPKMLNFHIRGEQDTKRFFDTIEEQVRCSSTTLSCLLRCGSDPSFQMPNMRSLLHFSASKELQYAMQILLRHGADIEAKDLDGRTPLVLAAVCGRMNSVKELLSFGANARACDNEGRNALHCLSQSYLPAEALSEVINTRISHNINSRDLTGMTPLHMAAQNGNGEKIDLLLRHGANPDIKDDQGRTPLFLLLEHFEYASCNLGVECLCREMKQICIFDKNGNVPEMIRKPKCENVLKHFVRLSSVPSSLYHLSFQTIRRAVGQIQPSVRDILSLQLPTSIVADILEYGSNRLYLHRYYSEVK